MALDESGAVLQAQTAVVERLRRSASGQERGGAVAVEQRGVLRARRGRAVQGEQRLGVQPARYIVLLPRVCLVAGGAVVARHADRLVVQLPLQVRLALPLRRRLRPRLG